MVGDPRNGRRRDGAGVRGCGGSEEPAALVDWDAVDQALRDRAGTAVAIGGATVELDED